MDTGAGADEFEHEHDYDYDYDHDHDHDCEGRPGAGFVHGSTPPLTLFDMPSRRC